MAWRATPSAVAGRSRSTGRAAPRRVAFAPRRVALRAPAGSRRTSRGAGHRPRGAQHREWDASGVVPGDHVNPGSKRSSISQAWSRACQAIRRVAKRTGQRRPPSGDPSDGSARTSRTAARNTATVAGSSGSGSPTRNPIARAYPASAPATWATIRSRSRPPPRGPFRRLTGAAATTASNVAQARPDEAGKPCGLLGIDRTSVERGDDVRCPECRRCRPGEPLDDLGEEDLVGTSISQASRLAASGSGRRCIALAGRGECRPGRRLVPAGPAPARPVERRGEHPAAGHLDPDEKPAVPDRGPAHVSRPASCGEAAPRGRRGRRGAYSKQHQDHGAERRRPRTRRR